MKKKLLIALFVAGILCPNVLFVLFRGRLDTANYENRALAPFPQMGSVSDIFAFPASFDAFYNDHVPFKNYFVRLNNKIDRDIFGKTSIGDVTIGRDNWLFYTVSKEGENALADYQRTNLYTQSQCEEIAGRLAAVESLVREKGAAQFKVYIAPNKESVYSQYMPKSVKVYGDEGSRMENFAAYMSENGQEEFVWLKPELMPYADQYQVYYKYDTHLNNLGSFLISQRMAEDLTGKALGLDEVTASQGQVVIGDMSRMINQESTMTDDHDFEINPYYPEVAVEMVQDAAGEEESFRTFGAGSTPVSTPRTNSAPVKRFGNAGVTSAPQQPRKDTSGFAVGARVRHARFGEGVITAMRGAGGNVIISVKFDKAGNKDLAAALAPLEII